MALEKESLINFLPDGFETLNQEGYKENFSADKIATGYEKDVKDRVTGPNFNNLLDVIGKNTNTLNNYVEYLNNMPVGSVPIVNDNNNLDYASGFVQKSGDTMTGTLRLENHDVQVVRTDFDYTSTEVPSESKGLGSFVTFDKNGKAVTGFNTYVNSSDGAIFSRIYARRSVNGVEKQCELRACVLPDGSYVTFAPTPATGDNSTKIATTAYCVNMRCTAKATTTSSASTTRPAWIVQNYVSGTSWYRVWSDGWIEQGGGLHATVDTTTGVKTITYLKSFANANYTFVVNVGNNSTDNISYYRHPYAKTNTGFTYNKSNIGIGNWYACGY